ncbi:glycosyltransferase [Halobacteria archaeon HArc-gm2]|nr:glycosyltransferase [Halobacteria archaeon HArc-gm2]
MRLLLLTDIQYPCDHLPFPANVFNVRFTERGHELIWVMRSGEDHSLTERMEWNGNVVYTLPDREYDPKRIVYRYVTGRLDSHPVLDIVQSTGPVDGVYVRNDLSMALVATVLSRSDSIPYFHRISHLKAETEIHRARAGLVDSRTSSYLRGTLGRQVRRHVCNNADLVVPISDSMAGYLRDCGYRSPLSTVTTGVDCRRDVQSPATKFRSEYGIRDDQSLLVYIGSLGPERHPSFLVDVLAAIPESADVKLAVIGGKHEERLDTIRAYAADLEVDDRLVFTGWISDQTTIERGIATADVALSPLPPDVPSLYHSSPVKVNEYLRQETAVVGTDIPDHRWVLDQSNGGCCVEYDVNSFAGAITDLLSDPERRARMGRNGRRFIEQTRCYDVLTDQLLDAFADTTGDQWS